jgi:CDP-glucose 4,6-dehydratase
MTSSFDLIGIYRNCRVLVTGHTGFKGSWLCEWLLTLGAKISGLALLADTRPNLFEILGLADRIISHNADIRDEVAVRRIFEESRPEIVFHLAAQPLVRRSYADPPATFATNVLGTAHVLDAACTTSSVRAVVAVTTDKVYHSHEGMRPYREIDPLGGLDPYSASKAAAELVAAVYQKNLCRDNTAIATARGGNVIGGGDWSEDRIGPDIVRAISTNSPIILRNPQAIRPWQHVLELCEAYLELGARLFKFGKDFAEPWNFGPYNTEAVTVGELTKMLLDVWGGIDHPIKELHSPLYEAQTLRLDIDKALSRLSWRPRIGIQEAVKWTARWYKDYYRQPLHARAVTEEQIRSFTSLIRSSRSG